MTLVAPVVSAIAASLAAVFAGLGLFVSRRREQAKWAREALVESMAAFLEASFRLKDIVKTEIAAMADSGFVEREAAQLAAQAEARKMLELLTKLRLLAPPAVIDAAEELRVALRGYRNLLDASEEVAIERDSDARVNLWILRQRFITQAKGALALPRPWRRVPKTLASEALRQGVEL